eukprot:scaffold2626_cov141-Amphora_coffeaeformis.AAC.5
MTTTTTHAAYGTIPYKFKGHNQFIRAAMGADRQKQTTYSKLRYLKTNHTPYYETTWQGLCGTLFDWHTNVGVTIFQAFWGAASGVAVVDTIVP